MYSNSLVYLRTRNLKKLRHATKKVIADHGITIAPYRM